MFLSGGVSCLGRSSPKFGFLGGSFLDGFLGLDVCLIFFVFGLWLVFDIFASRFFCFVFGCFPPILKQQNLFSVFAKSTVIKPLNKQVSVREKAFARRFGNGLIDIRVVL